MKFKIVALLLISILTGCKLVGQTLRMTTHLASDGSFSRNGVALGNGATKILVTLENISTGPLTVFTVFEPVSFYPEDRRVGFAKPAAVFCRQGLRPWVNSSFIVPPPNELGLVTLAPGEKAGGAVVIEFPKDLPLTQVEFIFEVDTALGTRYAAWHGKLASKLKLQSLAP